MVPRRGRVAKSAAAANWSKVQVSRPSDALAARAAADSALTGLFLGLGAVALLVGGIGIANTMVISVLERRSEIGLRRALGATRRHVSVQFLSEALLLSAAGCAGGVVAANWASGLLNLFIPRTPFPIAFDAGLDGRSFVFAMALAVGAAVLAGLVPALRASRPDVGATLKGGGGGPRHRADVANDPIEIRCREQALLLGVEPAGGLGIAAEVEAGHEAAQHVEVEIEGQGHRSVFPK